MLDFPGCKINLGLNILAKREDGFHNLESVFYPLDWSDSLEITPSTKDKLNMYNSREEIVTEQNIVWKALQLLRRDYDFPPVEIHLVKTVPSGGGLGGGSADGARTLTLINELFSLDISREELESKAAHLGSDCPFFISKKPAWVEGRGEFLEEIEVSLPGRWIVLVAPGIHISTADAFSKIKPRERGIGLKEALSLPTEQWKGRVINDFEEGIFNLHPELAEIKNQLSASGASYVSMTGTGSTVYGIFEDEPQTRAWPDNYQIWKGKLR